MKSNYDNDAGEKELPQVKAHLTEAEYDQVLEGEVRSRAVLEEGIRIAVRNLVLCGNVTDCKTEARANFVGEVCDSEIYNMLSRIMEKIGPGCECYRCEREQKQKKEQK